MTSTIGRSVGSAASIGELSHLGFRPLRLEVGPAEHVAGRGTGRRWDVMGTVPPSSGLYLFTLQGSDGIPFVVYAGQTSDLRMVTRGRSATGRPRPGQHYGRPRWAGATRQRINVLLSHHIGLGTTALQWVRPMPGASRTALLAAEEAVIRRWALRERGWNIG